MKLTQQHTLPHLVKFHLGVLIRAILYRSNRREEFNVPQQELRLTVIYLGVGLGGVHTPMQLEVELPVPSHKRAGFLLQPVKEIIYSASRMNECEEPVQLCPTCLEVVEASRSAVKSVRLYRRLFRTIEISISVKVGRYRLPLEGRQVTVECVPQEEKNCPGLETYDLRCFVRHRRSWLPRNTSWPAAYDISLGSHQAPPYLIQS
jgi:hypothetical protein